MLLMGYPTFGPSLGYPYYRKFVPNRLLPQLAESPTNTLKEMSSRNLFISWVRYSMSLCMDSDFDKAGICVA